jgi:hypothetical protein
MSVLFESVQGRGTVREPRRTPRSTPSTPRTSATPCRPPPTPRCRPPRTRPSRRAPTRPSRRAPTPPSRRPPTPRSRRHQHRRPGGGRRRGQPLRRLRHRQPRRLLHRPGRPLRTNQSEDGAAIVVAGLTGPTAGAEAFFLGQAIANGATLSYDYEATYPAGTDPEDELTLAASVVVEDPRGHRHRDAGGRGGVRDRRQGRVRTDHGLTVGRTGGVARHPPRPAPPSATGRRPGGATGIIDVSLTEAHTTRRRRPTPRRL